jgi:hypothetical protein
MATGFGEPEVSSTASASSESASGFGLGGTQSFRMIDVGTTPSSCARSFQDSSMVFSSQSIRWMLE